MRDTELYRHLLGLVPPWTVGKVDLAVKEQRVDVWAEHKAEVRWPCPECGASLTLYDHSEERVWRHLDSCQFMTFLHARPPRVSCPDHGVLQVKLPWAEPHARFTTLFERLAIEVLRETSVRGATRILRISWDEAWHIMERAVKRGLRAKAKKVVSTIGVDEKAIAKRAQYMTIVCDLDASTVEYVSEDRRIESLDGYFKGLSSKQLAGIEAVAMDMWEPYIRSTLAHVPRAAEKIVFDPYHIMTYMNKAVDTVRRQEHRERLAKRDEALLGTRFLWLYAAENLPERHREKFTALMKQDLKTGRAWALKENLRDLWGCATRASGARHWKFWWSWASRSRLEPVIKAARTVKRHIDNVLTYFTHRITNAVSEGINSKIQTIKKAAYGFRNKQNFKTAIFFHCGGLQLYPVTHGNPG